MQQWTRPPYVLAAAAVAVVVIATGLPLVSLLPLIFLIGCPLMMVFMMRGGMGGTHGGAEDHTGHGCEHDPARTSHQRSGLDG